MLTEALKDSRLEESPRYLTKGGGLCGLVGYYVSDI